MRTWPILPRFRIPTAAVATVDRLEERGRQHPVDRMRPVGDLDRPRGGEGGWTAHGGRSQYRRGELTGRLAGKQPPRDIREDDGT